ncbi:hypothetical protein AVEN_267706-1 [Araneus ventricosus]|uniref:Uncharacterized protein n=1 Tax=Araneus ventricosus TaxID=182803 RepID=A0A4Y2CVB5_ARAVE|nr:hypothetical protein AVEN_267706-1 [Araneus ventricosus]
MGFLKPPAQKPRLTTIRRKQLVNKTCRIMTTVTRAWLLLGTFSPDCHKYVPALVAFSNRLSLRRDTSFGVIRLNKKECAALSSDAHVFCAAVLKGLKTPLSFLVMLMEINKKSDTKPLVRNFAA